jgi:hypothetical protein
MRRRLPRLAVAAILALGCVTGLPGTAHADLHCSTSWHYITHGQSGMTARPEAEGLNWVHANGNRSADPWNQQVTFCYGDGWGANHYAIYSNRTGKYWGSDGQGAIIARVSGLNEYAVFEVLRYDSKWWSIRYVGNAAEEHPFKRNYVAPRWDDQYYGWLFSTTYPLNGNALWSFSPNNLMG